MAPANLTYSMNPAVYTKGVAITANTPSSSGGTVGSYSISPMLPAGLAIDTSTGVITGTPSAVTAAADYTVTATNTGGSATAILAITVVDASPATWYRDQDGDGYGSDRDSVQSLSKPDGYVADPTDCDDSTPAVNPGVAEIQGNRIDDNCDGVVDPILFADEFESSNCLDRWTVGGRQQAGVNTANCVTRHGSTMGHLYKESFTEITLAPVDGPFAFSRDLVFSFDMEVRVYSSGGAPSNYYCKSGVDFEFRDAQGAVLARVSYLAASTSYPFDQAAVSTTTATTAVAPNVNTHYSLALPELLAQVEIDETTIASVGMQFTTYSSTYPTPYTQAELWVDNVVIEKTLGL
jgi:hypothetical protein